ncbi:MAG: replication-associated recombination protein A [Patescibacteria group bacterium]|nr:replication-associated recombination protein A [Patescibacteria group bacterium]
MTKTPLAEILRPKSIKDYLGQEHLIGKGGLIDTLIKNSKSTKFFPSIILWGPVGSGKTTLARIIASELNREFHEFSAVNTSSRDIQQLVNSLDKTSQAPIVFIDEIHRFNKAQQDKLLPYIEKGKIILIGATTENPSFEVIGPLLSRCRVITLTQLGKNDLSKILNKALDKLECQIEKNAKEFLIESSNGDARTLLNVLEIASNLTNDSQISINHIEQALQKPQYTFDKKGEDYYNTISAFIKSMRASNPSATLYYLARMVSAGQDPLYIARRMIIFASEDIGMAQPTALVVANEVFRACETIGYPECAINLAHGAIYLATAKKDRSAYEGLQSALSDVRKHGNLPIPLKLRNAPTKLMKNLGYGKDYKMYNQENLLPEKLKGKKYYK